MSIDFIDSNEELVNKHNLSSSTPSCAVKSKQREVVHILDSIPCPVAQAINFEDIPTTVNHPPRPQLPPREANDNADVVNINSRTPPKRTINAIEIKKSEFPTPFKNALFWPEPQPVNPNKKIVKKKLTPTVATASEYIEYQRRLDEEKKIKKEKIILKKKEKQGLKVKVRRNINNSFNPGDYVVVRYEGEKFPVQVLKVTNGNPEKFQIKTMTMSGSNWSWPGKEDILEYDADEVVKKINLPQPINKRGIFSIPDM
ncbi:uncharacterized protein LOC126766169 [Bactrocera neohumeralis]|uniref:uncharacterized protein LOC126766169 n=1 Tax=Bactrocera neohumeralis TaxID=98809 RepID=UPI0021658E6D|nr:uncharacterized protein LOC126766169 [Bactrocera neohumeralis]